jgi:hypothetical protein
MITLGNRRKKRCSVESPQWRHLLKLEHSARPAEMRNGTENDNLPWDINRRPARKGEIPANPVGKAREGRTIRRRVRSNDLTEFPPTFELASEVPAEREGLHQWHMFTVPAARKVRRQVVQDQGPHLGFRETAQNLIHPVHAPKAGMVGLETT